MLLLDNKDIKHAQTQFTNSTHIQYIRTRKFDFDDNKRYLSRRHKVNLDY